MIKYLLLAFFSISMLNAQEDTTTDQVKVGDVFVIGNLDTNSYKHIDFPRKNFIIKQGGVVNYSQIKGERVVITSIKEKKDGSTIAKIKRKDGGRFFGSHTYVSTDIDEAIRSGELVSI